MARRAAGAGGAAGVTTTNQHDLTPYSGPFTIQYTLPAGGAGQASNRGHGGRGGGGYISYNVVTDSLKEITLGDPIGVNQSWASLTMAQNVWYHNNTGRPIQISLNQGVAGGSSYYSNIEVSPNSNGSNAIIVGRKQDDDRTDNVGSPTGKLSKLILPPVSSTNSDKQFKCPPAP